jgi:hypothetical protein
LPLDSIAGSGLAPGGTATPLPRRGVFFADGRGVLDEPLHWAVS